MIQVPPNATIVVMHDAINFRAGIDGTAAIARLVLEKDPMLCGELEYVAVFDGLS